MSQLQKIIYLTRQQYETLLSNNNTGQVTYGGITLTGVQDNNIYFITDETVSAADLGNDFVLPVNKGGTGKTQFTSGSLLVGNGQNALTEIGATDQNTSNTIVKRDSNGGFSMGLLKIISSGNTTTIGSQNSGWCHIYNSSNWPFIFNNSVAVTGGASSTATLGTTSYPFHQLILGGATNATMTSSSTNPRITFQEKTGTQPVHLIYTDLDSYRNPAGLKVVGGADANPAWFEAEGSIFANGGNRVPHTGNTTGTIGGTTTPVYVDGGQIKALSYTIAQSVPADAVFTDHYAWGDITDKPTKITLTGAVTGNVSLGAGDLTLSTSVNHNHNSSYLTAVGYDTTNKKIYYTKNGSNTDVVTVATLRTDMGLSNAMHFIGITSTTLSDGSTTSTLTAKSTNSLSKTTSFVDGDVVMDGDQLREYVWSGSAWRLLGITTSTAYTQPTSTATNTWIAQVSQGTDGKITATTGSLNTSGTWSGNATTATTATNLANNPSIQTSGTTQVTITAGGKTSSAYTIPYATSAGSATSATTATYIKCTDTRNTTLNPTDLTAAQGVRFDFKAKGTINLTATDAYAGVMSFRPYASNSDWSGGNAHQLAFNSEGLHWRNGGASWGNWYQILDSSNTSAANANGTAVSVTCGTDATLATINDVAVKINVTKPTYTYSDVGAAAAEHGTHVTTATVQSALGISSSGSDSKALTQKGTFVEFGTSNLTIGNTSSTAMAGNTNVNNVTQTVTTNSYSNWRPLLVGDSNGAADTFTVTTKTGATYGVHSIKVQPSSGTIKATTFQGNLTGNVTGDASTVGGHTVEADVPSDAVFTDTTYTFDGTYNASSNKAATVSTVTNAINALDGGTIGAGSTTKTITSLSQTNGNVSATFSDIAFPVSSVAGLNGTITASNLTEALGLSKALRFVGITTTDMTGGTATNHTYTGTPAGISDYIPIVGDVVINSTKQDEWVCTAVSGTTYTWERLGSDTSYKIVQSAVSDPTAASTTSTTFIDTISQDANGVISATKKTLPNYAGSDSAGGSANTVKQTPTTGTYYNWRKLLVGTSNNSSDSFTVSSDTSGSVYQVNTISVKPAEGILKASSFIGQFTGTGDLVLKTTTADSPDIVWKYGNTANEQEQARIWMGTGGSTKWAPQYRCYKQDGTQLYNGTLVLGDGTGASGTWAITASGNLPLTGGRLTGTLSLRPTSGEGGQINISASEENTSQTGIAIDQYNSTLRIFGIASADGTITGTGTSLIIHPYDATMEGDYRVKFKHIIATKQMIIKSGLVYYNDTTDSANDTKILAKSGMFFSDGIAFANPGLSAANDVGWIRVKGTTENNTELEIATGDDGDNATSGERIVVRQYKSSTSREAVLLEKGTGATTFPVSLSAPQLTLTSTSAVSHITFSRGGWNYITMPENDASVLSVGFGELGNNTNQRLVIFKTGTVRPGLNGGQDLGDNEHKWNHVYGINFYGTFNGTAASANQLNRISIANGSSLNNFIPDTNNGYLRYTWVNGANAGNDDDSNNPGILNKPKGTNAFGLFTFKTADSWAGQIFVSTNNLPGIYWRNGLTTNGSLVANWTRLANGNANIYYGESTTAAATAIKDVTCLHYHTLNVGDILVVKFTNANSANEPQLNVNSTGNKLIRASYSGGIVSLSSATQIRDTCMFIYDGTYWIQMSTDCVKQMVTTSSESVWRSVMVSASNNASESFTPDQMFAKTYVAHNVKFQASTGTLRATKFKGTEFKLEYEHVDKAYMTWNNTDQSIDFIFV